MLNNTLSSFKTHFENPLTMREDQEVALSEIILPTEWSNVRDDDMVMVVPMRTKTALVEAKRVFAKRTFKKDKDPEINWSTVDRVINLQKIIKSTNPFVTPEENQTDISKLSVTEMLEKELEEQVMKPRKTKKPNTYTNKSREKFMTTSNKRRKTKNSGPRHSKTHGTKKPVYAHFYPTFFPFHQHLLETTKSSSYT